MAKFNLWTVIKNFFKKGEKKFAHLAVAILEDIKPALNSQVLGFLAGVVDSLTRSNIAQDIIDIVNKNLPKVLATALALEGLPDNPTAEDILKFEQSVLDAFGKLDKASKFYTIVAADTYGIFKATFDKTPDVAPTFFELADAVQQAFKKFEDDKAANEVANQDPGPIPTSDTNEGGA